MKKLILLFAIATGILNAQVTILPGKNGGTGVSNTGKTITLGGSFITTGTSTPTLAFPPTSYTFTLPGYSGTLATLSGSEAFTNKTGNISMWTNDVPYLTSATLTSMVSSSANYNARVAVQSSGNPNSKLQTDENWSGNGWSSLLRVDTNQIYLYNDFATAPFKGIVEAFDYSANYVSLSHVNKGWTLATFEPVQSGTGYLYKSGTTTSYTNSIPNASLANSTISGIALGGTLFSHTPGYGLTGSAYNGSAAQSLVADSTVLVSKPYYNAKTALFGLTTNPLSQFASTTSSQLLGVISDETGTGKLVFGSSPTFTTPLLGTPTSGVLTNCTGLPFPLGITGTYTIGDLFQASSTSAISPLAAVSAGSYLRSAGTGSLSVWSTLKLPNTGTSSYIPYYSSTNTLGETSNMLYDGNRVVYFAGVYVNQYGFSTGSGSNFATATSPFTSQTTQNTRWTAISGFNNSSGAAARTGIVLQNNASGFFIIDKLGGSFTTSGAERQNCTHIQDIDAGLSLSSSGASGKTEFYTGGAASGNLALTLSSAQLATFAGGITMTVAKPLTIPSGTNTRAGNATLVGGTVTVNNTTVTANTIVILTRKTSGGTIGTAITYTLSASTSFTINSDNPLDTSTFSYMLIENP